MSKSTISTFQLFDLFPDQQSAREYLESRLWPDGPRAILWPFLAQSLLREAGRTRALQEREGAAGEFANTGKACERMAER